MCMCMVVVGFAKQNVHETIKPNPDQAKIDYYNLESHNGSTIQDWDINDYTEHLSDDKAAAFGHNFYVPAGRHSEHTITVCIDGWPSEGSWKLWDSTTGQGSPGEYITDLQTFSAAYQCNTLTLSLEPGHYAIDNFDSYGDGGQSNYVDGVYLGSSSGTFSTEWFELADPEAGGNCTLTMNDSYGDGWNGNEWCSGGQCAGLAAGSSGEASFDFDTSAANDWTCGGGSYASEVSWSLSCDGSDVASGSVGGGCFGNCGVGGCMDANSSNYNPDATYDDASCSLYPGMDCGYLGYDYGLYWVDCNNAYCVPQSWEGDGGCDASYFACDTFG